MTPTFTGAASEYAASLFNGNMEDVEETFTAGTTAAEIVKEDPERVSLLIINLSVNAAYLGFGPTVSSSNGIKLGANGGSFIVNAVNDLTLPTRGFWIVADGAGSGIYVQRMRRFKRSTV